MLQCTLPPTANIANSTATNDEVLAQAAAAALVDDGARLGTFNEPQIGTANASATTT
jgi:hypothetical protein